MRNFKISNGLIVLSILFGTTLPSCARVMIERPPLQLLTPGTEGEGKMQSARDLPPSVIPRPEVSAKFYDQTVAGSPFTEGKLNWNSLTRTINTPGLQKLELRPGLVVGFEPKGYEQLKGRAAEGSKKYRWFGLVKDKGTVVGEGLFIVDEKKQRIRATIEYRDKIYDIISLKNGRIRILELAAERFPEDNPKRPKSSIGTSPEDNPEHPISSVRTSDGAISESSSLINNLCVIEVLILYTERAETAWLDQGYADIWMEFDAAIENVNTAFAQSEIPARVEIAERKLIPADVYDESDESGTLDAALTKLTSTNWLLGQTATLLRDSAKADLVNFWVSGGDWCGASPYFTNRGPDANDGFSVVTVGCATKNKTLAHEFGHNLGARHSRWDEKVQDGSGSGYNFGHVSLADGVRTIMALRNECKDQNIFCRRESHYSNPDISYDGLMTKTGVLDDEPKAADNHQRLSSTVCKAAKYR